MSMAPTTVPIPSDNQQSHYIDPNGFGDNGAGAEYGGSGMILGTETDLSFPLHTNQVWGNGGGSDETPMSTISSNNCPTVNHFHEYFLTDHGGHGMPTHFDYWDQGQPNYQRNFQFEVE